jgi:hypothetical protein
MRLENRRILSGLLLMTATLIVGLAAVKGADSHAALSDWRRIWKWLIAGGAAGAAAGGAVALWLAIPRRRNMILAVIAAAVMLAGGIRLSQHADSMATLASSVLPAKAQRLAAMNLQEPNVAARLLYFRDALRIIRDYPLLGNGGDAWSRLYLQYQRSPYVASLTHNHALQVAVETGIPGFLAFAAFWAFLASSLRFASSSAIPPILTSAALTIGIHALIDFDLSFFAVLLLVAASAGIASARIPPLRWSHHRYSVLAGSAAALLFLFSAPQALGDLYLRTGTAQLEKGNAAAAARHGRLLRNGSGYRRAGGHRSRYG